MKILKFSPIKREQGRNTCHCYKETDVYGNRKPIGFTIDPDTKICFCNYCGNVVEPIIVLELMCEDWERIQRNYDRAREYTLRCYEIGKKFRPYKRVLKMLQECMGRKNNMMPVCPHCRKNIDLEKLANGVWARRDIGGIKK